MGWDGFLIGLAVAWVVAVSHIRRALVVTSRRTRRPLWRVAWDGVRALFRFMIETG